MAVSFLRLASPAMTSANIFSRLNFRAGSRRAIIFTRTNALRCCGLPLGVEVKFVVNDLSTKEIEGEAQAAHAEGRWLSNIPIWAKYLPSQADVALLAAGTLGFSAPSSSYIMASRVESPSSPGSYAWAVLDEEVKARINTPYEETATSIGEKTQQLGSGERSATELLPGLAGFDRGNFEADSPEYADFVSGNGNANFLPTAEAVSLGARDAIKSLTHDVTLNSLGVFSNTAQGGLKEDFQLLTNSNDLPSKYNGQKIYSSLLGIHGPSDPTWESLRDFASVYKNASRLSNAGAPLLKAGGPVGWQAATGSSSSTGVPGVINPEPPSGAVLMPTIAKVQMVFSLHTRDIDLKGTSKNSISDFKHSKSIVFV
jgi:hypothetical protein